MDSRSLIVAALILGGAIVAASFQMRQRYELIAADRTTAWRLDTWSGHVDVCAATLLPAGPLVRCGTLTVAPVPSPALHADEI